MATARPPGAQGETPRATIGFDYSQLRNAPNVAREAARATAREMDSAFRAIQNQQRLAIEQARQATVIHRQELDQARGLQARLTTAVKTESQQRIAAARAESMAQQQAARVAANTAIEEERRKTAAFRSELRIREAEQRASLRVAGMAGGVGGFARGAAGAALGAMGGPVGAIAGAAAGGALPAAAGLALVEGGRFAVEASQVATIYARQHQAAVQLAGSQARLNELMAIYHRVTRNAVDDATALANLIPLMAQGFAKTNEGLEKFMRGTRGASIGTGRPQDFIVERTQFEMLNQTGMRLNEIGLGMAEVRQKAEQLRQTNRDLTKEQAYQIAVIEKLNEKYGALVDNPAANPSGVERTGTAWTNLSLAIGKVTKPLTDVAGNLLADDLERETQRWQAWLQVITNVGVALGAIPRQMPEFPDSLSARTGIGANVRQAPQRLDRQYSLEQTVLATNRFNALNQVGIDESNAIADVTRQTSAQRASIIRQFELDSAREQEDFARHRLNAERKLGLSILDVAQDSARQRVRWEAETARMIEEAAADRDERIGQARIDSAERVAEIVEKFARDEEKRRRDHGKRLREAAANLDAVAVREEQLRFREETKERKEAHQEQLDDEGKSLQKRIDEANKAFTKQEADQRASLQRRIDQQAEDDALRIQQMKDAFADQVAQEDAERAIMVQRRSEDHQAQLIELDVQQDARIEQIRTHAQRERDAIEEEFVKAMVAEGARWSAQFRAHVERQEQIEKLAIDSIERVYGHLINGPAVQGPSQRLPIPSLNPGAGSYVPPIPSSGSTTTNTRSTSVVVAPGAIQIIAPPDMALDERAVAWFHQMLSDFFEDNFPQ